MHEVENIRRYSFVPNREIASVVCLLDEANAIVSERLNKATCAHYPFLRNVLEACSPRCVRASELTLHGLVYTVVRQS